MYIFNEPYSINLLGPILLQSKAFPPQNNSPQDRAAYWRWRRGPGAEWQHLHNEHSRLLVPGTREVQRLHLKPLHTKVRPPLAPLGCRRLFVLCACLVSNSVSLFALQARKSVQGWGLQHLPVLWRRRDRCLHSWQSRSTHARPPPQEGEEYACKRHGNDSKLVVIASDDVLPLLIIWRFRWCTFVQLVPLALSKSLCLSLTRTVYAVRLSWKAKEQCLSCVDIVYIVSCCLVSRDEEEDALRRADADENWMKNTDSSNWNPSAVCWNKTTCMNICSNYKCC